MNGTYDLPAVLDPLANKRFVAVLIRQQEPPPALLFPASIRLMHGRALAPQRTVCDELDRAEDKGAVIRLPKDWATRGDERIIGSAKEGAVGAGEHAVNSERQGVCFGAPEFERGWELEVISSMPEAVQDF